MKLFAGKSNSPHANPSNWLWIAGLLPSLLIAVLLVVSDSRSWTNSGNVYHIVINNRASVAIVVQVLSRILSAGNIYVLCCLFDFGARLRLVKTSLSLNQFQFAKDVCDRQLDWALPAGFLALLLIFQTVSIIAGAFWAGALTPITMSILSETNASINVSQYGPESRVTWGNLTWTRPNPSERSAQGVFSYSPNYDLIGVILTEAASASKIDDTEPTFRKLDNTRYSYIGRSYGVGSSVGLVDGGFATNMTQNYDYMETGYSTQVHCQVNSTSDWKFINSEISPDATLPNLYTVSRSLPSGESEVYATCGLGSMDNIFAMVGNSVGGENFFAITAGYNYATFDKIQCTVDFIPTTFAIAVNRTERLINVTVQSDGYEADDIESTGKIVEIAMRMPTSFSQQHGCDLYTSLVGNTFKQNIQAVHRSFVASASNIVDDDTYTASNTEYALRGVEDSLSSMLDNTLQAFSSAQLMIAQDVRSVPVSQSVSAVRIGQRRYIYIVGGITLLILMLSLCEILRTKAWVDLIEVDFTDLRHMIIAAARGGNSIVQESLISTSKHKDATSEQQGALSAFGEIRVRLEVSTEGLQLKAVNEEDRTVKSEEK